MTRQELRSVVRDAVNKYDPEHLLSVGCPNDEYDPVIEKIAAGIEQYMGLGLIRDVPASYQIWIIVCNVLHWYFGRSWEPVLYWPKHRELAFGIYKSLEKVHSDTKTPSET